MAKRNRIKIDHSNCECMIRQKGPHWGLFCAEHGSYIKWLGRTELQELRKMDIGIVMENKNETAHA